MLQIWEETVRIVLTGATGFIGRRLATRLVKDGHDLWALVRRDAPELDPGVKRLRLALNDPESLRVALRGCDALIHLAGTVRAFSANGFLRVNQVLTAALADGFNRFAPPGAVLLSVSSQAAGGPCTAPPGLREFDRPAPVSQYGLSKLLGEAAVLALTPRRRVGIARPPIVYGPGDMTPLPLYRSMAHGLLPTSGPPGQYFSIIHVDDLTDGLRLLLERLAGGEAAGIYHFAGPENFAWEDYAVAFGLALGCDIRVWRAPASLLHLAAWGNALFACLGLPITHLTPDKAREARAPGWLLDDSRARRELSFAPRVGLRQGAAGAIAWCRAQGLLTR